MAFSTSLLMSALIQFSATSGTYIYKWVDYNGITHYSQQEPIGVISEKVNIRSLQPKKIGTVSPVKSNTDIDEVSSIVDTDVSNALQSKAICSKALHNLKLLKTHTRLLQQNNKSKEPVALSEKQRQAAINQEQQRIDAFCKK